MARHLVFFLHSGPEVRPQYVKALEPLGPIDFCQVYLGGYSSAYSQEGNRLRGVDGTCLTPFLAKYGPNSSRVPASISVITFSAGYALARSLLQNPMDAKRIDCLVAIDSIHASYNSRGVPSIAQLGGFIEYARRAKLGECLFYLGHSDVRTPKFGLPNAFASTTECARAIESGVLGQGGNFKVSAYDTKTSDHDEHIDALIGWGAKFAGDAICNYLLSKPQPMEQPAPWLDPSLPLGERCVLWSLQELADGVREIPPGSNDSPRIREYLDPIDRDPYRRATGEALHLSKVDWCASAASFAHWTCARPGEAFPSYRVSGIEMVDDAKENGSWKPVGTGYVPRRGDIAIYQRGTGWQRHVVRVLEWLGPGFKSIGGNEDSGWRVTARSLNDPDLLGFIPV